MVEAVVGLALGLKGGQIAHQVPGGQRRAVDQGHHAVDGGGGANFGPAKGLHQGFGQRQPRGLNHNAVDLVAALHQHLHGGQKLFLHRAAEAAIGQFENVGDRCLSAILVVAHLATAQQVAVDAHFPKFVDQNGNAPSVRVLQQLANQGGFASP